MTREDQIISERMFWKSTELYREKFEEAENSIRESWWDLRELAFFFLSHFTVIVIHFLHIWENVSCRINGQFSLRVETSNIYHIDVRRVKILHYLLWTKVCQAIRCDTQTKIKMMKNTFSHKILQNLIAIKKG